MFISDGSHQVFVTDEELNVVGSLEVIDGRGRKVNYVN